VISSSLRPLPDNTQHSQHTNIHATGEIRTHDFSRPAAADLRLRQHGHWDKQLLLLEFGIKGPKSVQCNGKSGPTIIDAELRNKQGLEIMYVLNKRISRLKRKLRNNGH
jgi:hypothetical protein